ncbi:hypothetical protein ALC62_14849 [Cyphomyrmex costatus]|uniref:Uncharacterized protein n=1 Tax=Cyphomyrmex costatus TaxID=456900 RepID=A0A195C2G6_9HYME|nr:hypothetical protein ALC62_14849 [Cyphomyrmex costatus]
MLNYIINLVHNFGGKCCDCTTQAGKKFECSEILKIHLNQFILSKEPSFWSKGIMQLPKRWDKIFKQNSTYLVQ